MEMLSRVALLGEVHLHLVVRDAVNAPQLIVLSEVLPRGHGAGLRLRTQQSLRSRICEEENFAAIESQHFGEPRQNFVGRMPFARSQMPNSWRRCFDPMGNFLLREV